MPKATVTVLLLLAIGLASGEFALAGDGTVENPWHNENLSWANPPTSGRTTQFYQDGTVIQSRDFVFWATQIQFTTTKGFYIGPQTKGLLHSTPELDPLIRVDNSAVFSLFGNGDKRTFRMLTRARCSDGADDGTGVTCARRYGRPWSVVKKFRVEVRVKPSKSRSICPESSPKSCDVYSGYVNRTFIAKWSIDPTVYGSMGYTNNFLEAFDGSCAGSPEGEWRRPFYKIDGIWDAPTTVNGFDSMDAIECGRSWIIGTPQAVDAIRIKVVQP